MTHGEEDTAPRAGTRAQRASPARQGQVMMEYLLIFAAVVGIVAWAGPRLVVGTPDALRADGGVLRAGDTVGLRKAMEGAMTAIRQRACAYQAQLAGKACGG